jgi:hypothetical protein
MKRLLKRSAWCLIPVVVALAFAVPASAGPEPTPGAGVTNPALLALIGNDDLFSVANLSAALAAPMGGGQAKHFGPYASGSPDSGTCGNDWAQDTFDRHFTVKPNGDGTNSVVEQFKDGSFTTVAGPSPGGCDTTYTNHGTTVDAGKTGSMHGYEIISNVGTQTNDGPFCDAVGMTNANCTTATFIATHFAPSAYTVTTFFFHYAAGAQGLLYHEWKNASDDRGGNGGDIATG